LTSADRVRRYRENQKVKGLPDVTRRNRKAYKAKARASKAPLPFVGCDGEGCSQDALGRQLYMLFRMGDRELFTGHRLTTSDILDFICDHPATDLLVGFAFGYDVTMILRDLPEERQRQVFKPMVFAAGHSNWTWYKYFDIQYLPRNYLRVRRVKIEFTKDGKEVRIPVKGSTRTIYETFGFFQKSFLKCIKDFNVAFPSQIEMIQRNKDARAEFDAITQEVREYCALECRLLAQLMENLRDYCREADIHPKTWSGAGKLAAALHAKYATPKTDLVRELVPLEVQNLAGVAYYGGRFEITRVGAIRQKVYEYDIRSAYPAAMLKLPCLVHGQWRPARGKDLKACEGLFIAGALFKLTSAGEGQLGGFPVRSKEGHLYWPLQGSGVYWSPEIRSAERLGYACTYKEGWIYDKRCDCHPFDWVQSLYDYRKSIGSSGPGYPIKLGLNSLYGKLAQRKGNGQYANMIWAGLITALTRATLNDAIAESLSQFGPGRIVMLATDAVYSLDPLPTLDTKDELGAWEKNELDSLFIVQPGLYWDPSKRKRKSRGLSGRFFEEAGRTESFEREWHEYEGLSNAKLDCDFPSATVPIPGFIGLKLALSRNKPETAGTWIKDSRTISFDYRNKRSGHVWRNGHIVTGPIAGGPHCVSLPHRDFLKAGGAEPWENARLMLEEQPEPISFEAPKWDD